MNSTISVKSKFALILPLVFSSFCTYYSYSHDLKPTPSLVGQKIGVTVLKNLDTNHYAAHGASVAMESLIPGIKAAIQELNKDGENFIYLDALGENYDYDFTQEYREFTKRNIIELRYAFKNEYSYKVFTYLTLGLVPTSDRYRWVFTPIYYDNQGVKKELPQIEIDPYSEYYGLVLFPFWLFQSKGVIESYTKDAIQSAISAALQSIPKAERGDYAGNYQIKQLPFRMKRLLSPYGALLSIGLNSPNISSIWYPKDFYNGCRVQLKFLNTSDKQIIVSTSQFWLVAGGKEYQALQNVEIQQKTYSGSYFTTNKLNYPLGMQHTMEPKSAPFTGIDVVFEYPMNEKPSLLRWKNPNHPNEIVEIVIPEIRK
ncbi:hypothetical protein [Leptospira kobayashii]|nr:hypothetical protein [Leptospira kobayashii]